MVLAGSRPLDRAHAHARWAERYNDRSDPQRAAAHFGRALHYAQMAQAFGAPDRGPSGPWPLEADLGDIVVGRWEDGAEAWTALYSERTKRSRMQQVFRGRGTTKGPKGPAVHRAIPDMLEKLYASERRGITGSVHSDEAGHWYIHRCYTTGIVYLVPAAAAAAAAEMTRTSIECGVRSTVKRAAREPFSYASALEEGLLIVQDQSTGRMRVQRGGAWEPATKLETFAYYDFLLRYPENSHCYQSEKDEELSKLTGSEVLKSNLQWLWTTFPSAYVSDQNEAPKLTMSRNGTYIFASNEDDPVEKNPARISDVAWRLPMCSPNEDF